jgi:hypothetical protein
MKRILDHRQKPNLIVVFMMTVLTIISNNTQANSLVVPNYAAASQTDNTGEGVFTSVLREQVVYNASEFPPYPIIINEIRWRPDSIAGGPITVTISNIQINLSTTLASSDHLNSSFFQNTGTNDTVVFSGMMNVLSSFNTLSNGTKAFDINLPLQTPFVYDSSKGNLLIDLRNFTGCNSTLYNNGVGVGSDGTSRIYATDPYATSSAGTDSGGGVIEIIYEQVAGSPRITSQPTNKTVTIGGTATFSVVADPGSLFYKWFFGDINNPIEGATNSSMSLVNVQTNQAGDYFVLVTNTYGQTFSSNATLTVTTEPTFLSQPVSQTTGPGGTAVFSAIANGSAPIYYQWFFNLTNAISGATNTSLVLSNIQEIQSGVYSVQASNSSGMVASSNAVLSIAVIVPNYQANSQSPNTAEGIFTSISREQAVYNASEFPFYPIIITEVRWRPDSIAGGPVTTTISNIQINLSTTKNSADHLNSTFAQNIGTNETVVFSGAMHVTTSFATLGNGTKDFDIELPLETLFTFDPSEGNLLVDIRNFTGCSASLYDNGIGNGSDPVSRIYTSGNANAASASGADSGAGVMQIRYIPAPVAPSISSQPTDQTISIGSTATLALTAGGVPPLTYQWFSNDIGHPVTGATNNPLILVNAQTNQTGNYFAQVTGPYGSTLSSNAVLTVTPAPVIILQPINQVASPGDTVNFTVIVSSGSAVTYQWYFNNTNLLVGATNATLTLTNIQLNMAGVYSVQILNAFGSATSSTAALKIGLIVPNYAVSYQPNNLKNTFVGLLRLQTVYGSNQFPAYPVVISELRWRPDVSVNGPLTDSIPNLQINLSTTLTNADHLNSSFAKNIGTNETMVFSGPLTISTAFASLTNGTKAFDISVPLQNPFIYDATKGNLLVDVRNFNGGSPALYTSGLTTSTDTVSRAYSGNVNATTVASFDTAGEAMQIIFNPAPVPPTISVQPTNRSLLVGSTASFAVVAGPPPLTYQWFYNTNTLLNDATNASLVLTNVQFGQSGAYFVVVSNTYGATTSSIAVLTASFPPVNVLIGSTNAMGGNSFTIPVLLAANGNENTLSFSMNFDTQWLAYASIDLGSGAVDGLLLPNTSQAVSGRLGVTMRLPSGETFAPGTQEVVRVTFASAIVSDAQVITPINFTNQPINRFVFDVQTNKLATNFINGSVTLAVSDFEGDVTPRQTGDRSLDIFDWTQVGGFVAGLDIITNAAEFQRADVAPKSSSGDGQLKVTDWVQAGRYGAAIDSPVVVGGPTVPVTPTVLTGGPRTVNIAGGTGVKGLNISVPVILQSQGNENAVGFSASFNTNILKYVSTAKGSAASSATLLVNTNLAASGTVGVMVALQAGNNFTNGAQQEIARMIFTALNPTTNGAVTFASGPVLSAVSDPFANELAANYSNNLLTINPPPALAAALAGTNVTFSWPAWGTGFNVQGTRDLVPAAWTNIPVTGQTNGTDIIITVPLNDQGGYFRLQHP